MRLATPPSVPYILLHKVKLTPFGWYNYLYTFKVHLYCFLEFLTFCLCINIGLDSWMPKFVICIVYLNWYQTIILLAVFLVFCITNQISILRNKENKNVKNNLKKKQSYNLMSFLIYYFVTRYIG